MVELRNQFSVSTLYYKKRNCGGEMKDGQGASRASEDAVTMFRAESRESSEGVLQWVLGSVGLETRKQTGIFIYFRVFKPSQQALC